MGKLIKTSLDAETIAKYIAYAGIHRDHIYRHVITYPLVRTAPATTRAARCCIPRLNRIRDLATQPSARGHAPDGLDTIPEDSTERSSRSCRRSRARRRSTRRRRHPGRLDSRHDTAPKTEPSAARSRPDPDRQARRPDARADHARTIQEP